MAEKFYTILTNIGKAKIANSGVMGNKVNFVKFKLGDGSGSYYDPTEDQKDLVHTVYEGNITDIEIDADNPNWMKINLMIPANVGGFMIREYGVFDAEGNMLAVAKCAESYKPIAEDGSTKELILRMILAVSNTKNISLELDPTLVFVTKEDLEEYENKINAQLSDFVYQTAGGTGTALTLTIKGTLMNGYPITFIASANNSGAATTINGKKLYKPGTTTAPNLIAGKAYTVWYNQAGDCFFIKASAEGDADVSNVLATKKFSNDNDTGLIGTMPNNGQIIITPGTTNKAINKGFHDGTGYVAGDTDLISSNIKAGINIFGVDGKASVVDTGDATAGVADIVLNKTAYINGNKVTGQTTIESLGGKRNAKGVAHISSGSYNGRFYYYILISSLGLNFIPRMLSGYITAYPNDGTHVATYNSDIKANYYYNGQTYNTNNAYGNFSATDDMIIIGYSIPSLTASDTFTWEAWG